MSSTSSPVKQQPLAEWQQDPAGHTVFPATEWPLDIGTFYCYPIATLGQSENYCYVLIDKNSSETALVDPAEPTVVLPTFKKIAAYHQSKYKSANPPELTHILTTHKHWDHAGGNNAIRNQINKIQVVGGKIDNVEACTKPVQQGDKIEIGGSIVHVYDSPCHTKGHVLYYTGRAVFTGDTMFAAGCGKFFEGDASQMYRNLYETIDTLPDDTYILCGHEYTASNLEFVHWLEPDNKAIAQKLQYAKQRRQYLYPVIPTTLDEERQINSFLRVREPSVAKRVEELAGNIQGQGKEREIQLIGAIRSLKDNNAHKKSSL